MSKNPQNQLWKFTNRNGDFIFPEPQRVNRLYFPLANESEFMSSITPLLRGDIKTDQNHFLTQPVSGEDLYNIQASRNFWVYIDRQTVWSAPGVPPFAGDDTQTTLQAGILWHTLKRTCPSLGLSASLTNFVPVTGEHVEIMKVTLTNISSRPITFTPTAALPIFGRSADNLRDHRHVTSLLQRISAVPDGVIVTPLMSFDERGHKINRVSYFVLGCENDRFPPQGVFPTVQEFIGEGGDLNAPAAVLHNIPALRKTTRAHQGKEAMGALRFQTKTLIPGESVTYVLLLGIAEKKQSILPILKRFRTKAAVEAALAQNIDYWKKKIDAISFSTADAGFDNWLRWVTLQPILRKIFGCSFLPDFDYGRGGKGWRDLWQDCLTLIFIHPGAARKILAANFSGVRIDGTNATIITKKPGFFIADRNRISRVWMDHGVWPFFTLNLYIHQTGDFEVLFDYRPYFYDRQLCRSAETDYLWKPHHKHYKHLHTKDGRIYKGSILEHILVQHLVQFFNVGRHNNIRLEGGDWNDGLDMAAENGESVAFTCFYGGNLYELTMLLIELKKRRKRKITLARELLILLDALRRRPIDYHDAAAKTALLQRYFKAVKFRISGKKITVPLDQLISDLSRKWQWLFEHVRTREWINFGENLGFFNGYYDNKSRRVEGRSSGTIRMTLTGQAFALMHGIATRKQTGKIFRASCLFLRDKRLDGFRLNTDFKKPQFDLGRAFAFAYGEKENGAVFSHMCVMFANALYKRGFAREGFQVLQSLFRLSTDTNASRIYPCLPEYFNLEGKGMYAYLTGSASWYIMTLLSETFGIKGRYGDLVIAPKLVREQFKFSSKISLSCYFAERRLSVTFHNPHNLDYGGYILKAGAVFPAGLELRQTFPGGIGIKRSQITRLPEDAHITLEILLAAR